MVGSGRRITIDFTQAFSWLEHQAPFAKLAYMNSDCFKLDRMPAFGFLFSYILPLLPHKRTVGVQ